MRQSAENNALDELIEHDLSFHRCICEWSGSRLLLNSWTPLYSTIQRFIFQTHPAYFADLYALADTHLTLIDAFRSRNEQTVVALIQEHVMLIWQMIGTRSNLESIKNEPSSMT
jgi:DNA-binding GntR family transcriptional regulator